MCLLCYRTTFSVVLFCVICVFCLLVVLARLSVPVQIKSDSKQPDIPTSLHEATPPTSSGLGRDEDEFDRQWHHRGTSPPSSLSNIQDTTCLSRHKITICYISLAHQDTGILSQIHIFHLPIKSTVIGQHSMPSYGIINKIQ